MRRRHWMSGATVLGLTAVGWAWGQSGSRYFPPPYVAPPVRTMPAPVAPPTQVINPAPVVAAPAPLSFEQKLWDWLARSQYRNWSAFPGQSIDFISSASPHGPLEKVYIDRAASANLDKPINGALIVKESYSADRQLQAILVMYRVDGYNPAAGDWWYAKFSPTGAIMADGTTKLVGKVQSCTECHATAGGGDYLFSNDKAGK